MSILTKATDAVGLVALSAGVAVVATAVLFFVGEPAAATEVADCWTRSASPEQLFREGHHPGSLAREACLGLGTFVSVQAADGADQEYWDRVTKELASRLKDNVDFRQGQYAALAEQNTLLPEAPAKAAGELGMMMEKAAATRLAALRCGLVTSEDVAGVGQFDSLLALSVAGERIGMPDLESARAFSDKMLKRAVEQALSRAPSSPACGTPLETELVAHLKEWQLFAEGKHPWAEGCRPEVTATELILRCA